MLRVLISLCLLVALLAARADDAPSTASGSIQQALDRAARMQGDPEFLRSTQEQRQAVRSMLPRSGSGLASAPASLVKRPTSADLVSSIRSPSMHWSQTNRQPLLILVSFSMPDEDLRELAAQGARVGAQMILRGLVDNSFQATEERLARFADIPGASFQVDPTLFRRFNVQAVPTFILPLDLLQVCNDAGCPVPRHVKVSGEAGLDHVLRQIHREARDPDAQAMASAMTTMLAARP